MKYWIGGTPFTGIEITTNNPGVTKYWERGKMYGDIFPGAGIPPAPNPSNFLIWFF